MPIFDTGTMNLSAIDVPDAYIGITPPQPYASGVPSSTLGIVGTASWGAVNTPVLFGDMSGLVSNFGAIQARKYDLGTHAYLAGQEGASDFRGVRVTDGTDVKASHTILNATLVAQQVAWNAAAAAVNSGIGVIGNASRLIRIDPATGIVTALFTGSYGDTIAVASAPGAKVGTWRLVVSAANRQPEVFDNLVAAAGEIPTLGSFSLSGGTDGATTITTATLVGDITLGTGMYALANQNCAYFLLADADDSTEWSTQGAFALQETSAAVVCGPAGEIVVTDATARLAAAGVDDWRVWCLAGDWIWFNDQTNGVLRLVSPQGVAAGKAVALSPEQVPGNKQLNSVAGTQKVGAPGASQIGRYSYAELQALTRGRVDVITAPAPGGSYFAVRIAHNTSSDQTRQSLSYTTMTNFVAKSLLAITGKYVHRTISPKVLRQANAEVNAFFALLQKNEQIGSLDGSQPWFVQCNAKNNPQSTTGLNYLYMKAQCQYLGIIEKFVVDYEGGASVTIGS
jgi:hypothetical protein